MGKLIFSMLVSLDGYVEGPNQSLDWDLVDEELHTFINGQTREIGTILYGRRMYEVMSYWETADQIPASPDYELEFARIWKGIPKIVFSKSLEQVSGNARLVREVNPEEIAKLKQSDKDLEVAGPALAATFRRLGLIDEYSFYVHPVILGGGTAMLQTLDDGKPGSGSAESRLNLRLVETRTFGSGVVYLRYQPADH